MTLNIGKKFHKENLKQNSNTQVEELDSFNLIHPATPILPPG